jgi:hypothetical protein
VYPIRSFVAAVLLLSTSCASQTSAASQASPAAASPDRVTKDPNLISRAELQDPAIAGRDASYAIQQLRPAFFRTRGSQSMRSGGDPASAPGQVRISQDFGPLQPVGALAAIDTRSLIEIRYLDAVAAQARFGINANGGPVIVLLSTKQ